MNNSSSINRAYQIPMSTDHVFKNNKNCLKITNVLKDKKRRKKRIALELTFWPFRRSAWRANACILSVGLAYDTYMISGAATMVSVAMVSVAIVSVPVAMVSVSVAMVSVSVAMVSVSVAMASVFVAMVSVLMVAWVFTFEKEFRCYSMYRQPSTVSCTKCEEFWLQ